LNKNQFILNQLRKRVEELLKKHRLTQSEFESRSGYSKAVLSNFLTGKTDKPRIDLLEALIIVFPTLNLNWLITGKGETWDGPAPAGLEDLGHTLPTTPPTEEQQLLNRLLIAKLKEVAAVLRERDPALYEELRLGDILKKS
jgi:transcriptional regulator with XRE-family HTH domain